jgi:hypothetical protein
MGKLRQPEESLVVGRKIVVSEPVIGTESDELAMDLCGRVLAFYGAFKSEIANSMTSERCLGPSRPNASISDAISSSAA